MSEDFTSQDSGDNKSVDNLNCTLTAGDVSSKIVERKRASSAGKKVNVDSSTAQTSSSSDDTNTKVQLRERKSIEVDTAAIRASLKVGRKKIMSIFKEKTPPLHKPPPKPPRNSVKISGPVMSSLDSGLFAMSSGDNMIPVRREGEAPPPSPSTENPYTEVHFSEDEFTDDSQDGDNETPKKARRMQPQIHPTCLCDHFSRLKFPKRLKIVLNKIYGISVFKNDNF